MYDCCLHVFLHLHTIMTVVSQMCHNWMLTCALTYVDACWSTDVLHLEAHMGTWLKNSENIYQVNWGTLRANLDFMDHLMKEHGNQMENMVPTWHYAHVPFPTTKIVAGAAAGPDGHALAVKSGFKYSLDIKIREGHDQWSVEKMVMDALKEPSYVATYGSQTCITPKSRRSNGNHGKYDKIEAHSCKAT